jgi:hypothetical protein
MRNLSILVLLTATLSGCFVFGTSGNAGYYGGGGIGLFVVIVIAAILFGRRSR